jgi:hypothetical protein
VFGVAVGPDWIEGAHERVGRPVTSEGDTDHDPFHFNAQEFLPDREADAAASGTRRVREQHGPGSLCRRRSAGQEGRLTHLRQELVNVGPDGLRIGLEGLRQVSDEFVNGRLTVEELPNERTKPVEPVNLAGSEMVNQGFAVELKRAGFGARSRGVPGVGVAY